MCRDVAICENTCETCMVCGPRGKGYDVGDVQTLYPHVAENATAVLLVKRSLQAIRMDR